MTTYDQTRATDVTMPGSENQAFNAATGVDHDVEPWRPQAVSAAASGKAIIVGEHAVVYGARAVAMPVPSLRLDVRLTPTHRRDASGKPLVRISLGGRQVNAHLRGVVDDAFLALGIQPFAFDLVGHSTILVGAGLGSSASLCIVVLKALAAATGRELGDAEAAQLGNALERRFHGNPSGLDTAVVARHQVIVFRRADTGAADTSGMGGESVDIRPLAGGRPWRFALLDSMARSSTLAMVQGAAPWFQGPHGDRRIAAFDALAEQVINGFADGEVGAVAAAMSQAGAWLAEIGVVNQALESLMAISRATGCLATKPTGAGGGGCVLSLLHPEMADEQLARLRARIGASHVYEVQIPLSQDQAREPARSSARDLPSPLSP